MNNSCFKTLPIKPSILENLDSMGYQAMTPIQADSLGPILKRKDVIAQAKTGSGKTAAFGIGLLSAVNPERKEIQSLVLCPTRELANQVASELRKLARRIPNFKILTLCGGSPIAPQVASLTHGAHCVVATPGRMEDLLHRRAVNLRNIETLVLDEADRMLDMGFADVLDLIIAKTPRSRQTLLFSATYPENIQVLSKKFQNSPVIIKVDTKHQASKIEEKFFTVEDGEKRVYSTLQISSALRSRFNGGVLQHQGEVP